MERNTLIYAFSPLAIVVRSAFKTGGTWIGATDALRRRLTTVAVRGVSGDRASETLCRLGAIRIRLKKDVLAAIYESGSARDDGDQLFAAHG